MKYLRKRGSVLIQNNKKSRTVNNYLVILFYAAMVGVNALANILPINDITTGEVSDSYSNLFAPAGLTFSIWGVIYLLLGIYAIYQLVGARKVSSALKTSGINKINIYFILSCVANICWILLWHYKFIGLSTLLIFALLVCLIFINQLTKDTSTTVLTTKEKIFVRLPFSIYFGWITVASIANVTTFLVSINWNSWGLSDEVWTIIILIVGLAIAVATMISNKDIAYGLTVLWAYFGIAYKHISESGFSGEYPMIIGTVVGAMVVLLIASGYLLYTRKKRVKSYY